jgi:hypothetical protein
MHFMEICGISTGGSLMKKILWKSDFRSFTVLFGVITLFFAICSVTHLLERQPGEAFGAIIAMAIPLVLTAWLGFCDSDRIAEALRPEAVEKAKQEALKNSFLNWKNIPPNKRSPPPGMIG